MRQYTKTYINELLKKFMDGTTTLAEEDVLSNYFLQQRDVPQEWQDYRQLFAELEAMKPQAGNEQQAESRPVRRQATPPPTAVELKAPTMTRSGFCFTLYHKE